MSIFSIPSTPIVHPISFQLNLNLIECEFNSMKFKLSLFKLHATWFNIFIQMKLNFHRSNYFFHRIIIISNMQQHEAQVGLMCNSKQILMTNHQKWFRRSNFRFHKPLFEIGMFLVPTKREFKCLFRICVLSKFFNSTPLKHLLASPPPLPFFCLNFPHIHQSPSLLEIGFENHHFPLKRYQQLVFFKSRITL